MLKGKRITKKLKFLFSGLSQNFVVYVCATKGGINYVSEFMWYSIEKTKAIQASLFLLLFLRGVINL